MAQTCIGAQMFTLRDFTKTPADIAATLKKVKALGYGAIQVSAFGPIDNKELRKLLDDSGLVCASTHMGWVDYRDKTQEVIERHQILGCKYTALGGMPGEYRNEDGYKRFAHEASVVARTLKEQGGLTWGYHNHSFEMVKFGKRTGLEILYAESDPAYFTAEIDTFWITNGGGDPAAWIRKFKGRSPQVHFKDLVVRMGAKGEERIMAEVGEGNLNWPEILKASKEAGAVWYLVEQDTCQRDPFECLGTSLQNLKSWGLV